MSVNVIKAPVKSRPAMKRMRVVIEIDCDNSGAMFHRKNFNEYAVWLASKATRYGGVVYVATEEANDSSGNF